MNPQRQQGLAVQSAADTSRIAQRCGSTHQDEKSGLESVLHILDDGSRRLPGPSTIGRAVRQVSQVL
jgi:hypothetical protein